MVSSNGMAICRALSSCILFLACCWLCVHEAAAEGLVPALYVLGDSQADNGNNNHLVTLLRADFPHNGVDYGRGNKATGRFSNGKNFVDFLAEHLNLASTPPPYMSIRNNPSNRFIYPSGVNFASGGAGVSSETNKGQCISFDQQIDQHYSGVYKALVNQLGQNMTLARLAKSIFTVAIGGNDILNYVRGASRLVRFLRFFRYRPSPEQFIASLAQSLEGQLERMYALGMRKLFVVGAAPLGCCPVLRKGTPRKECHAEANELSAQYNVEVAARLRDMRARHPDMRYSFFDGSTALLDYIKEPKANGYAVVDRACCGLGKKNAMFSCTPVSSLCENRTNHIFWDFVHPTEITAQKLMALAFDGPAPLATPMNVRQLISAT
ncbi:GDSL esterase/lipase At5g55050 [Brachypodium distachyon]|uniref:GDSL esterase/lipase n=1 Tax=Brachypodium distachyon TaxID=15368 RepID=A0A0Q3J8Y6_BRADI|nr:GDSL esterase/lipase At5g55050 [Brachypodium distachyon]KQK14339.1 hypothetical protein BRADI_1g15543v3 [Brachypodium distachyon]|eukprot:XP_003559713.1 GDSL esterase/lipase At5g55050 [Brachypodium distachyon]